MQTWNVLFENGKIKWSLYFKKIIIKHWNHIGPTIPLESSPYILLIQLQLMRGFYSFPYRECQKRFLYIYGTWRRASWRIEHIYIYIYNYLTSMASVSGPWSNWIRQGFPWYSSKAYIYHTNYTRHRISRITRWRLLKVSPHVLNMRPWKNISRIQV